MRIKNKAIRVIRNAQVKCYSNTINLWKHLISSIRTLAVFSASAVSLYDDINTRISSPAALRVTSLALFCLI